MIEKSNFLSIVCGVFTCLLIGKLVLESLSGHRDAYYIENIFFMFGVTVVATFILSLHKYLQSFPVALVILVQYVVLIGCVMGGLWLMSRFSEMNPEGYKDMFWTVTIPYAVLAGMYYVSFFVEVKKANRLLAELNVEE